MSNTGNLEEQLAEMATRVTKQGDLIKKMKDEKAAKGPVDEAVQELKRLKAQMDGLKKAVESKNLNPFESRRENLKNMLERRFFFRPSFDIYGGVAGFYSYGPPGCAVKNNIISIWRRHFVIEEGLFEIEDTCIMPHRVLKASGHVDRFNDFMVKAVATGDDKKEEAKFYRADKLLEQAMEAIIRDPATTAAKKEECMKVAAQADGFSREELHAMLTKYDVRSPDPPHNALSEPYPFNLMFPTPIGPAGDLQGYLRPETAQGIFLNFKYCLGENGGNMPFGMAQVGKAFRNEIAPRAGLIRMREFTQAEIEWFCKPEPATDAGDGCTGGGKGGKPHAKFAAVARETLSLLPSPQQLAAQPAVEMTVEAAVRSGTVANETLGFFLARTQAFLVRCGIRRQYIRFRQHLPTEMAHYACDCWDAEIYFSHGWVECVGHADRSAFDLTAHAEASGKELQATEMLATPVPRRVVGLSKKSAALLGKDFKKDAKAVGEYLASLGDDAKLALQREVEAAGRKEASHGGASFALLPAHVQFEEATEMVHTNTYVPNVVEPSFGIDRIMYALLEHTYWEREEEAADAADKKGKDHMERGVLSFPAEVAPLKCALMSLDMRIARDPKYQSLAKDVLRDLAGRGISAKMDDSGVAIGKRYARTDELGVPFAMTFDFESLQDASVTLRERDSCTQVRMAAAEAAAVVQDLCEGRIAWPDVQKKFVEQKQTASAKVGKA